MATTPDRILVWGAGGHGKVVADLVRASDAEFVGYVDADERKAAAPVDRSGGRLVATEDVLRRCIAEAIELPAGATAVVPAIGDNAGRSALLVASGEFLSRALLHPDATMSPSAVTGAGTVVLAGAVVNAGAAIGRGAIINTGAVIEHDCEVGNMAHISPGAVLAGAAVVGNGSWIGAGAVVIEGVRVGNDAIVGAGAIVIRDVLDGQTVVGNPANPLAVGAG